MNGPEHYREAERLLAAVTADGDDPVKSFARAAALHAAAQVHATLALAAATALPAGLFEEWQAVAESRPGAAS